MTQLEIMISGLYHIADQAGHTDWTVEMLRDAMQESTHRTVNQAYSLIFRKNDAENVFRLLVEKKAIASADLNCGLDNVKLFASRTARQAIALYRLREQREQVLIDHLNSHLGIN